MPLTYGTRSSPCVEKRLESESSTLILTPALGQQSTSCQPSDGFSSQDVNVLLQEILATTDNITGFSSDAHAMLKTKEDELVKEGNNHRAAVLAEIRTMYTLIKSARDIAKQGSDFSEKGSAILPSGEPAPWKCVLKGQPADGFSRKACSDTRSNQAAAD